MVRGSNPGGGEIFRIRPDRPCCSCSLLYNEYRLSLLGINQLQLGIDYAPQSSAEVEETVELYFYSPSGLSWYVLGQTLPFIFPF
jgi:hypothetical protein